MSKKLTTEQVLEQINELNNNNLSLIMATVSEDGLPNPSYAPFVYIDEKYYILISDLAQHTLNIKNNHKCTILLTEDESKSRNIFARVRLTYDVDIKQIANDTEKYHKICDLLQSKTNKTVSILQTLGDFNLFELTPQKGLVVLGFAKAYKLDGNSMALLKEGHPRPIDRIENN